MLVLFTTKNLRKLRLLFEDFPKNHNLILMGRPNLLADLDLGVNQDMKSRVTYSVITKRLGPGGMRDFLLRELDRVGLGREGPPAKRSEGYFRFLCPGCGKMRATVNPRNNLAHCFCCKKNLNNIDLLLTLDYDFASAVALLERWLHAYQAKQKAAPRSPHR